MKLFYSPMKLIEIIKIAKEKDTIDNKLKENTADWYFSKDGENAFNNAKTPAQKTMYFFHYLLTVAKVKDNRETLYKIAYIMANSMVNSSLEFAGYPNVLDSTKNRLVERVKNVDFDSKNSSEVGIYLLAALQSKVSIKSFLEEKLKQYTYITYCEPDGSLSDMYKIERDIIGAFCAGSSDQKKLPPYEYDIISSSRT